MKLHFILNFLIGCNFLADVRLWESGSKSPVIYPERFDLVVDVDSDLTLGCRGSEMISWTFQDQHNKPRNNSFTIIHSLNENDPDYKFQAILIVEQVSHTDVGFYYCHGEEVPYNTPLRSNSIYIYVNHEKELSVLPQGNEYSYAVSDFARLPCRRTSPNVKIELFRLSTLLTTVNASDYKYYEFSPRHYETIGFGVVFHPYYGFLINLNYYSLTYSCRFIGRHTAFEIKFSPSGMYPVFSGSESLGRFQNIALGGPEEVYLNDNVTLTCTTFEPFYFLFWKNKFVWKYNNKHINDSSIIIKNRFIVLKENLIIRSELTITNASVRHSGIYFCQGNAANLDELFWTVFLPYEYKYIPCISTSSKCSVSLDLINKNYMRIQRRRLRDTMNPFEMPDKHFIQIFRLDKESVQNLITDIQDYLQTSTILCIYNYTDQALAPRIQKYRTRKEFFLQMPGLVHDDDYHVLFSIGDPINKTTHFHYRLFSGDIRSPPSIVGPRSNTITMNEKLELICKMLVYHNVSIDMLKWETPLLVKHEKLIDNTSSFDCFKFKVIISKLTMHNVRRDHEGRYKCYIPNSDFAAEEYISVIDPFNVEPFVEIVEFSFAYIGQKMHLECSANISHNVPFSISWNIQNRIQNEYDDQGIINMSYVNKIKYVFATSVLQINNVTHGHAGNYTCVVSDYFNHKRHARKQVLIKSGEGAKIRGCNFDNHSIIEVERYSSLVLNCSVDGDPEPNIVWKQNFSDLKFSRGVDLSVDNKELTIILVLNGSEGLYTCTAQNLFGEDHIEVNLVLLGPLDLLNNKSLVIIGIFIILFAMLSILLCRRIYRHKKWKKEVLSSGLLDIRLSDYDTKWEIPKEKIKLGETLGSGYFGFVMKSSLLDFFEDDPDKIVAVKMLHPNCGLMEINSLISEMQVLAHIGYHVNLIKFLGACTEDVQKKQLLIIMEYCEHGNLGDYLIAKRDNFINLLNSEGNFMSSFADGTASFDGEGHNERVSTLELLCWALQVAQGMQFLACRKVVHGDLAARNVLLSQNNIVKISDFGLAKYLGTKNYYKKKSECPLPIKWMAIESIREKIFSSESDVWAFGVFLWELFSLARTPYPDLQMDFSFYHKILGGYRLEHPTYSPLEVYKLMCECWQFDPALRPTFQRLVDALASFLPRQVRQVYMPDHNCQKISDPNDQQDSVPVPETVSVVVEDSPISECIPMQQLLTEI